MAQIQAVAIVLCDNDYGSTIVPLLDSIYAAFVNSGGTMSADLMRKAIVAGIPYHFIAFQLNERRGDSPDDAVSYLLNKVKILFDSDAKDASLKDHDGGSWYLDLDSGQVHPI